MASLSVDVSVLAKDHVKLLAAVHVAKLGLYEGVGLQCAMERYLVSWLPALRDMLMGTAEVRAPSLEECWVWHLHKLDPVGYRSDCLKMFGRVLGVPARMNPFLFCDTGPSFVPGQVDLSSLSADLVGCAKRQSSFLWQVGSPQYEDDSFLRNAATRYEKLLQLVKLNPGKFLVPTYDMDLMWHTHLAFPLEYETDTVALAGALFTHDDTVNDRSEGSKLNASSETTKELWAVAYPGSTWEVEGGMYRGEPPSSYWQPHRPASQGLLTGLPRALVMGAGFGWPGKKSGCCPCCCGERGQRGAGGGGCGGGTWWWPGGAGCGGAGCGGGGGGGGCGGGG